MVDDECAGALVQQTRRPYKKGYWENVKHIMANDTANSKHTQSHGTIKLRSMLWYQWLSSEWWWRRRWPLPKQIYCNRSPSSFCIQDRKINKPHTKYYFLSLFKSIHFALVVTPTFRSGLSLYSTHRHTYSLSPNFVYTFQTSKRKRAESFGRYTTDKLNDLWSSKQRYCL